jgi:hypothetical protein
MRAHRPHDTPPAAPPSRRSSAAAAASASAAASAAVAAVEAVASGSNSELPRAAPSLDGNPAPPAGAEPANAPPQTAGAGGRPPLATCGGGGRRPPPATTTTRSAARLSAPLPPVDTPADPPAFAAAAAAFAHFGVLAEAVREEDADGTGPGAGCPTRSAWAGGSRFDSESPVAAAEAAAVPEAAGPGRVAGPPITTNSGPRNANLECQSGRPGPASTTDQAPPTDRPGAAARLRGALGPAAAAPPAPSPPPPDGQEPLLCGRPGSAAADSGGGRARAECQEEGSSTGPGPGPAEASGAAWLEEGIRLAKVPPHPLPHPFLFASVFPPGHRPPPASVRAAAASRPDPRHLTSFAPAGSS